MKNVKDIFNSYLLESATFSGEMEIPCIRKEKKFFIPKRLVPFSKRKYANEEDVICFYEHDYIFMDFINNPEAYVDDLRKYKAVITPDISVYVDMPIIEQEYNIYKSRAIGSYLQQEGIYIIPNVRWGDERTFTTNLHNEMVAFLGIEKKSIVAVGQYGQIRGREDKRLFRQGFIAMLDELEPEIVLVYGKMSKKVFDELLDRTKIYFYEDWISLIKRGRINGND